LNCYTNGRETSGKMPNKYADKDKNVYFKVTIIASDILVEL
jgi:hypothetical protein